MPSKIVGSVPSALATEKALGDHVQFTSRAPVDGTARSRSTSAGSSSAQSCEDARSDGNSTAGFARLPDSVGPRLCGYPASFDVKATSELPAYDYPVPLVVRNTFIDTDVWRPSSLCDFIQQRQVRSCPASVIGESLGLEELEEGFATSWPSHQAVVQNMEIQAETVTAATLEASMEQEVANTVSELRSFRATSAIEACGSQRGFVARQSPASPPLPSQTPIPDSMPQLPETTATLGPPLLQLSDSLPWPQLGSPALPTVDSASHQQGFCRPCAFLHTKGCAKGVQCTFCHLCEPGEQKRRRKNKLAMRRAAKNQGPPPTPEVMNFFFMSPKKGMQRAAKLAAKIGGQRMC